jgi:hypothetical protein
LPRTAARSLTSRLWSAAALPVTWSLRALHGYADVEASVKAPEQTLEEVRAASAELLPGSSTSLPAVSLLPYLAKAVTGDVVRRFCCRASARRASRIRILGR